jgi:hypothetical protein
VAVGFDGQFLMYSRDGDFPSHELIITTHGLMRLRRRSGALRPYAEGLAGFKGFSMDSRLPTSSYGIGAGMQFPRARRAVGARTAGDRCAFSQWRRRACGRRQVRVQHALGHGARRHGASVLTNVRAPGITVEARHS